MTPTERVEQLALRIIDNPWFENWRQDARDKLIGEILKALSLTRREAILECLDETQVGLCPCGDAIQALADKEVK